MHTMQWDRSHREANCTSRISMHLRKACTSPTASSAAAERKGAVEELCPIVTLIYDNQTFPIVRSAWCGSLPEALCGRQKQFVVVSRDSWLAAEICWLAGPIFSWGIKAISSNKRFLVSGRNSMLLEANLVWKKNDFSVGEVISSRTNRFVVGHSDFPLSAVT